ncbi:MAG: class I SAM-dependent methyltransferase [Ignavibacteriales bacterium]|nr:class I SAM-dependent methyltransferase [Ignavibacteriales bacterium]
MNEWFIDWFNSDEYLKVYQHRDDKDAKDLVDLILRNISIPNNSKILDSSCGAGRHSILLAKKGYSVTAFDLSKKLLKVARQKAKEQNVKINFLNADIRNIYFKTKFELILNLFTSFGYFDNDDENFAFIKKSYELLNPNGYLILDYFNTEYLKKNIKQETHKKVQDIEIIELREIIADRIFKRIKIYRQDRLFKEFYESVKLYSYDILKQVFKSVGYREYLKFGDYSCNPYNSNSERLIILFQK